MKATYHVAVIEDDPQWQYIIQKTLLQANSFSISLQCTSGEDFVARYQPGLRLDLAIVDVNLPGKIQGFELAQLLRSKVEGIPILIFATSVNRLYKNVYLDIGMFKLDKTDFGDLYYHVSRMLNFYNHKAVYESLESHEKQLLLLIAEGFTSYTISQKMYRSESTIEKSRKSLADKLGFKNKTANFIEFLSHLKESLDLSTDRDANMVLEPELLYKYTIR